MVDGEAYARVTDLTFVSAGVNLAEAEIDYIITSEENLYSQQYSQKISFGFLRNSGKTLRLSSNLNLLEFTSCSLFQTLFFIPERTSKNPFVSSSYNAAADDIITLTYNVKMLDHVNLKNGFSFPLTTQVLYGVDSVVAPTTTLYVEASTADTTVLSWNAQVLTPPGSITRE